MRNLHSEKSVFFLNKICLLFQVVCVTCERNAGLNRGQRQQIPCYKAGVTDTGAENQTQVQFPAPTPSSRTSGVCKHSPSHANTHVQTQKMQTNSQVVFNFLSCYKTKDYLIICCTKFTTARTVLLYIQIIGQNYTYVTKLTVLLLLSCAVTGKA